MTVVRHPLSGLHSDDPREIHDALPGALMDCRVEMPDSDAAAADIVFAQVARLHVNGAARQAWLLDWQLLAYGRRFLSRRSSKELTAAIRKACEEQLRSASAA